MPYFQKLEAFLTVFSKKLWKMLNNHFAKWVKWGLFISQKAHFFKTTAAATTTADSNVLSIIHQDMVIRRSKLQQQQSIAA